LISVSVCNRSVFTKHYNYFKDRLPEFRIYRYDLDFEAQNVLCRGSFCDPNSPKSVKHTWIFEYIIDQYLLSSGYLCQNPEEADLFFVPIYFGVFNLHRKKADFERIIIPMLERQGNYFNRYGGVDHIIMQILFSHDRIPITPFIQKQLASMISIGDIIHSYSIENPRECSRFTVLPYSSNMDSRNNSNKRNIQSFYIGQTKLGVFDRRTTGIRNDLVRFISKDPMSISIISKRKDPNTSAHLFDIAGFMEKSEFCPVPQGDGPSSKRLFDAYQCLCIPVLLSDEIRLPFESQFIDYSFSTLQIPMNKPRVLNMVYGVCKERCKTDIRNDMMKIRTLFEYNSSHLNDMKWAWLWNQYFKASSVASSKRKGLLINKYM